MTPTKCKKPPLLYTLLTRRRDIELWKRSGITGRMSEVIKHEQIARIVTSVRTHIDDATPEEIQRWMEENE